MYNSGKKRSEINIFIEKKKMLKKELKLSLSLIIIIDFELYLNTVVD